LEAIVKNLKILVAGTIGVAALGGGIAAAATTGGSSNGSTPAASAPATAPATAPTAPGHATVNVATATVNGRSEQVLVDATGLPLYTYNGDSGTTSNVSGALAQLWPPLDWSSPTETGTSGTLSVVNDSNGSQVQYGGHFLYTFVSDSPGKVTGQGVQGFYVATAGGGGQPASSQVTPASTPRYSY
jgi:predicted lipoprotein with Yx(FWY)xxD motif